MSDEQRTIYEQYSNIVLEIIKKRSAENNTGVVKELVNSFQILQMAVDNPELILNSPVMNTISELKSVDTKKIEEFKKSLQNFDYISHFNKLKSLDSVIEYECTEMGNKIIVFYYHPQTVEYLKKIYPNAMFLTSDIEESERFKIVEDFRKDEKCFRGGT